MVVRTIQWCKAPTWRIVACVCSRLDPDFVNCLCQVVLYDQIVIWLQCIMDEVIEVYCIYLNICICILFVSICSCLFLEFIYLRAVIIIINLLSS